MTGDSLWVRAATWVRSELWQQTTPPVIHTPRQRTLTVAHESRILEVTP